MKIPAGKQLVDVIQLCYKSNQPILLEGPPGVGKSEIMKEAARALNIGCTIRDLSLMEAVDLAGLPIINPASGKMSFASPDFLPHDGNGLFFIEELNRAGQHVMAPCLQLLTERCLNDYRLPTGWLPVAAINPTNLDGIIADELDAALRSRFCIIEVTADVGEWLLWAETAGIHDVVKRFVRDTPAIFEAPRSSPRSWAYVSRILTSAEMDAPSAQTLVAVVAGLVGQELAEACLAYRDLGGTIVPDASQVVHDYPSVRKSVQSMAKAGNTSFINALVHKILIFLQDPVQEGKAKGNKQQSKNVRAVVADLPAEFRTRIAESHPGVEKTPS